MEKFFEQLNLLERLDGLIRRKATGKPTELASRLGICERKVYKLIGELKAIGVPIAYSNERESYFYESEVEFQKALFTLKNGEKIKGGENFLEDFFVLHDLCSGRG
jgi:hypothetical protein